MKALQIVRVLWLALCLFGAAYPFPAQAALEYNQRIPFQDDFDSCSGERVLISGVQHIVGQVTRDGAGRTHFNFTRNTHGSGLGYLSGDRYTLVDSVYQSSIQLPSGDLHSFAQVYHTRLLRRGEPSPADDTLIHFLTKITFNAAGEMTTSIEIQSVSCQ